MGFRRKVRELALGYLYQDDVQVETSTSDLEKFGSHFDVPESQKEFFEQIVYGVKSSQEEIDSEVQAVADNWKLSRMARVDRVILRMASWELKATDTPHKVIIDEAVEIARKFSTTESAAFVNGLLDKLAQKYRVEPAAKNP